MGETREIQKMDYTLESSLSNIDEERLPQILSQRLELLEKTNQAYDVAKKKEEATRDKVKAALTKADALITESQNVGQNKARERKFLWADWTSKKDEIEALKANLQEIISHGENSAVAQRELVEVQAALAESQKALLDVQKAQMEYQGQIADATKFLYGLSAYNMGSVQSVLINLKAVLSGANKEKLGEMAQQQLLLAMDQIKNQESIILRIRENKELIDSLDVELQESGSRIEDLQKQDAEHDSLIENLQKQDAEQDSLIEELQKQDEEQDSLIEDLQKQDEEQDKLIAQTVETTVEHERLIQEAIEADEEQDKLIAQNAEKAKEHERLIQEAIEADEEQDKLIAQNAERAKENTRLIQEAMVADEEQDKLLELQQEKDTEHDRHISELQNEVSNLKVEIEELKKTLIGKSNKLQVHIVTGIAAAALILALLGVIL